MLGISIASGDRGGRGIAAWFQSKIVLNLDNTNFLNFIVNLFFSKGKILAGKVVRELTGNSAMNKLCK